MSSPAILDGSFRRHPALSEFAGLPAPDASLDITLVLRRKQESSPDDLSRHVSASQHAALFGARQSDLDAARSFAAAHGLLVIRADAATRCVVLRGPLATMQELFGADLELRSWRGQVYRMRQGHLCVPQALAETVVAVLGFDQRPAARTDRQVLDRAASPASYTPVEIAALYNFPKSAGKDQTIALIELGGGYRDADLANYWSLLGINKVEVTAVAVDSAQNAPTGDPESADGEVALDIQVAGAVAPASNVAVYFSPNTDAGFLAAINAAIHDTVRKPSVISISWGAPESEWTPQAMNAFNAAFHDAALLGISVCVAAGDNGSSDGETDGKNHVDFPASSPWVLSCGGTRLTSTNGKIQSETVWNDGTSGGATGGGVSSHFSKPRYQSAAAVPKPGGTSNKNGRGVPDVAGVADPESGYLVLVDGQQSVVGGTSAVAPLWAGLIALCNEQLGRNLGWFNPQLYGTLHAGGALRDITSGNNGTFHAAKGWDPCTGLGTPDGTAILNLLRQPSK